MQQRGNEGENESKSESGREGGREKRRAVTHRSIVIPTIILVTLGDAVLKEVLE